MFELVLEVCLFPFCFSSWHLSPGFLMFVCSSWHHSLLLNDVMLSFFTKSPLGLTMPHILFSWYLGFSILYILFVSCWNYFLCFCLSIFYLCSVKISLFCIFLFISRIYLFSTSCWNYLICFCLLPKCLLHTKHQCCLSVRIIDWFLTKYCLNVAQV